MVGKKPYVLRARIATGVLKLIQLNVSGDWMIHLDGFLSIPYLYGRYILSPPKDYYPR